LFQGRRGYCTYFAGALTVLCRAAGMPARVVSGFANPEWQGADAEGVAVLRAANAHAWTEVWIDGWGWTTLDATPSDDRGDNAPGFLQNFRDAFQDSLRSATQWMMRHLLILQFALLAVLLVIHAVTNRHTCARPIQCRVGFAWGAM
jgi:hypothetical protein